MRLGLITFLICTHAQSHRRCFDVYVIHFGQEIGNEGSAFHEPNMIKSDWIIPSVSDSGDETLTLNVTTNTTLSTNMFYRATLITTMDMIVAGSILFCKSILLHEFCVADTEAPTKLIVENFNFRLLIGLRQSTCVSQIVESTMHIKNLD